MRIKRELELDLPSILLELVVHLKTSYLTTTTDFLFDKLCIATNLMMSN